VATTTATDILSATDNYGKAAIAFETAITQAKNQRNQAMVGLGADFTLQTGKVLTPEQAGKALGGGGLQAGTTQTTGYGEGALATIDKGAVGAAYAMQEDLTDRGVGTTSGVSGQSRLLVGDQAALASQAAVQEATAKVGDAAIAETTAKGVLDLAAADKATAESVEVKAKWESPKQKEAAGNKDDKSKWMSAKQKAALAAKRDKAKQDKGGNDKSKWMSAKQKEAAGIKDNKSKWQSAKQKEAAGGAAGSKDDKSKWMSAKQKEAAGIKDNKSKWMSAKQKAALAAKRGNANTKVEPKVDKKVDKKVEPKVAPTVGNGVTPPGYKKGK